MRIGFVGAGEFTVWTAELLINRGHEVIIIEKDENKQDTILPSRTISRYLADMVEGLDILELSTVIKGEARFFTFIVDEEKGKKTSLTMASLKDRTKNNSDKIANFLDRYRGLINSSLQALPYTVWKAPFTQNVRIYQMGKWRFFERFYSPAGSAKARLV